MSFTESCRDIKKDRNWDKGFQFDYIETTLKTLYTNIDSSHPYPPVDKIELCRFISVFLNSFESHNGQDFKIINTQIFRETANKFSKYAYLIHNVQKHSAQL